MAAFQFKREQIINSDIDTIWDFVSSPKNLKEITPSYMLFQITSDNLDQKMYPGMIITYKVAPILNIKIDWMTEITHVRDKEFFIDEQRMGPYKMWHHQHIFEIKDDGVLMKDIITYIPPFGLIGQIANKIFIKKQLKSIFDYRQKVINEKFNQ